MTSSAAPGKIADVIANPLHPAFRILTEWFPDEARKLSRMPAVTRYEDIDPAQVADIRGHAVTLEVSKLAQLIQGGGLNGTTLTVEDLRRLTQNPGNSLQLYPSGERIEPHTVLHEYGHAINLYRTGGMQGIPAFSPAQITRIKAMGTGIAYGPSAGDQAHQALDIVSKLRARKESSRRARYDNARDRTGPG